jgi:hypothetical protein
LGADRTPSVVPEGTSPVSAAADQATKPDDLGEARASARPQQGLSSANRTRKREARADGKARRSAEKNAKTSIDTGEPPQPVVSDRQMLLDDVAGLEEEIDELRRQLARRLHLQNAQLRKMLERFDV